MTRRIATSIITALCLTALTPTSVSAEQTVTGYVYLDSNHNSRRDAAEQGLPNVRVSNGCEVVATDGTGKYELPIDDDDIIFVIKPRDYMTPVSENNLPQFYYIHKPKGSPQGLKRPGITPTGPLPKSVDFALCQRPEKDRFSVIFFGDPQPGSVTEVDYVAHDVVEELVGTKEAVFGVSLGDLGEESVMDEEDQVIGKIGLPWYNVPGNHDVHEADPVARTDDVADDRFQRCYGPTTYSFDYGPVHFLVIDNITSVWDDGMNTSTYWAEFNQDTLEFVRNDLIFVPKENLVVLMFHIPLREGNRKDLFALLKGWPHTLSLSGHDHQITQWFFGPPQGWPNPGEHHHIAAGAICGIHWLGPTDEYGIPSATTHCGSPNGYITVHFNGNRYHATFKAPRRPADNQMHIFTPSEIMSADSADAEVVVNVYMGTEKSVTEMKLGESGRWIQMTRDVRVDPYLVPVVPEGHPLGEVEHIWVARLPTNLPVGTHVVYVRSKDMYGKTHTAKRIIRIR